MSVERLIGLLFVAVLFVVFLWVLISLLNHAH